MNKFFLKSVFKASIAALLVVVMWIFQYYPEIVDFKFWLGLVVVLCILVYMVILVGQLANKVSKCQKETAECKKELEVVPLEETEKE